MPEQHTPQPEEDPRRPKLPDFTEIMRGFDDNERKRGDDALMSAILGSIEERVPGNEFSDVRVGLNQKQLDTLDTLEDSSAFSVRLAHETGKDEDRDIADRATQLTRFAYEVYSGDIEYPYIDMADDLNPFAVLDEETASVVMGTLESNRSGYNEMVSYGLENVKQTNAWGDLDEDRKAA